MTPVEIKLEHGLSVAVIFIEDMAVMLTAVQSKIREEVDELVPENFHFILNWGPPISCFQETKTMLKEALHEGNVLVLREAHSSQNPPKRMAREIETSNDADVLDQMPPAQHRKSVKWQMVWQHLRLQVLLHHLHHLHHLHLHCYQVHLHHYQVHLHHLHLHRLHLHH